MMTSILIPQPLANYGALLCNPMSADWMRIDRDSVTCPKQHASKSVKVGSIHCMGLSVTAVGRKKEFVALSTYSVFCSIATDVVFTLDSRSID